MSLKSFHVVFIAVSSLLSLMVGVWALQQGREQLGAPYLAFAIASLALGVGLAIYGVFFIRKTKGMVVDATNRKSSYRVLPGGSRRSPR